MDSLIGYRRNGFYVDVGCNHPVKMSNTFRFYLRGWRGIAIDGNSEFAKLFSRYRPRDYFIAALVSDEEKLMQFKIYEGRALSSVQDNRFLDNDELYKLERIDTIKTKTINQILKKASAPERFDILSIDVEGHDFKALRSIDLKKYKPDVILIEANGQDLDVGKIGDSEIAKYLSAYSYSPIAVHAANIFFRRNAYGVVLPDAV